MSVDSLPFHLTAYFSSRSAAPSEALSGKAFNTTFSSRHLRIAWEPPSVAKRNGIITRYDTYRRRVRLVNANVFEQSEVVRIVIDSNQISQGRLVITNQVSTPASDYEVYVRACVGSMCSRKSKPQRFSTDEDRKLIILKSERQWSQDRRL